MEGLIILAVFAVFIAPLIISITAIVKVANLRDEISRLEQRLRRMPPEEAPPKPARPLPKSEPAAPQQPAAPPRPAPVPKPAEPEPPKSKPGVEFIMGGRAAAFAGIAILVIGIALLVGYAIQNAWLGPGARVLFGLASGLVLAGLGHWVSRLDEKYTVFSRVLTGGGSALFYFTVFAAYAFYHLIGAVPAGIGLFISAAAVFGLAMFYASQSVAVLGVLGAFVTPLLIGGELDAGVFPLVYIALVNVPVILLGVRRKWQWLYNLAFLFTVIHSLIWMDRLNASDFVPGLLFFIILYLQFAGLGLLKLRHEKPESDRIIDLFRLILVSVFLPGMVYWLFSETGRNGCGTAFALLGLLQFGAAALSHKILKPFTGESTALVSGGMFALAMALPVQFDGEWISLGWGIQGAVLAWFALRVKSRTLQGGAFCIGLIGVLKVLVFDIEAYGTPPSLFLNARFAVGLISAALLAVQGSLAVRMTDEDTADPWTDLAWIFGTLSAVLFFFTDVFWTRGAGDPSSWLLTSAVLFGFGLFLLFAAPQRDSVSWMGCLMFMGLAVKMFLFDSFIAMDCFADDPVPFRNPFIWTQLVLLGLFAGLLQPRIHKRSAAFLEKAPAMPSTLNITALVSMVGIVTAESVRLDTDWAAMGITILWAFSALALILFGMKRRTAPHRYLGLILFGLATLKVLIVDSSELDGLQRIGAFIGTGLLLLILAFAYQKASAFFQSLEEEK